MNYSIVDIETDGLVSTKIHCISVHQVVKGQSAFYSLTDYDSMRRFFLQQDILIGHNITRFDIPEVERVLGIKVQARLIDTLAISWYLYPMFKEHGLEIWGERLGIAKPQITDWQNLTIEEYVHRCEQDVQINTLLFNKMVEYLKRIYGEFGIDRIMNYLTFKLDCAREQEQVRWKLDVEKCKATLQKLEEDRVPKIEALKLAMPKVKLYTKRKKPKMMTKQDGSLSIKGENWLKLLEELGLPPEYSDDVKVQVGEDEPNPRSTDQVKDWLYSLGWVPRTFKFSKDKMHNIVNKVPQVNAGEGKVCDSVRELFEKEPALENLEGLSIINHRITILEGFLRDVSEDGYLKAQVMGLTNTLRFQHTEIVNVPTINKPYGKEIRGCLTVPDQEEYLLCGSDMSSLEDNTKQHYIFFFDPEYVKEMRVPGFDPHLSMGRFSGEITEEEEQYFKWYSEEKDKGRKFTEEETKRFNFISKKRKDNKIVNFSAVYGVGAPKMSLTTGWPIDKSKKLLQVYWKRNWAVKKVAEACTVKIVDSQMWLWNPVSKFYYSLRFEKDRFSTLNQGTGVYCFDMFVKNVRKRGIRLCGQFHDEICFPLRKSDRELVVGKLNDAIKSVNEELKLNIELGISMDFGLNYAETH